MLFEALFERDLSPEHNDRLEAFYKRRRSAVVAILLSGFVIFLAWASFFEIDQVARGTGEVIASNRVQVIQAVDGGVLATLEAQEGDRVEAGQVLATLDTARFGAGVGEIEARLAALKAKQARLRAEVTTAESVNFPEEVLGYAEIVAVELALFEQRTLGQREAIANLERAVALAKEDLLLVRELSANGDSSRTEEIRAERGLNEAQAQLINRRNRFLEEAQGDLARVEDEIAQNEQILILRRQQLNDSVFRANLPGIVKNVRVTTVGGVLREGEELMQIVPVDDELIVEAKISPVDIASVQKGLDATIRFDAYDYTIYGGVEGRVSYVSADTLKEKTAAGEDIYYRVHVVSSSLPVTSSTGKVLEILPGMTAQIDIRTGRRTLMNYLLKPIKKTLSESLGER